MLNFDFHNPTKILFGKGRIADLAGEVPAGARVMLTYGGGSVKKYGVLDQVKAALSGYDLAEFGGIEPNPRYETLMKCVEQVRSDGIDFLLAVGGGSVVDGTKFIAAAAVFAGNPWEIMETRGAAVKVALPLGTVLTLPATGSEMNCGSVVTREETKAKLPFLNPAVFPRFSVLDPTTTYTLPPRQTANGVIDTFVHIVEQYLTYPAGGKVQDRLSEGLLLTLIEEGPKALAEPENYEVRANLMWCATLGLNGLLGAGVPQDWATHMVGHEITALHGLDHGQTLAIVLPAMLEVRRSEKHEKLLQYARRVWDIRDKDQEQSVFAAIARTREFFEKMGVKTSLGDYGIGEEAIEAIVAQLEAHGMDRLGENRDVTPYLVRQVLQLCL